MIKNFTYRNGKVYYKSEGEGPTVVLLHGFAETSSIWDAQIASLKNHCRIIAPDLPGSGKSAMLKPDDTSIADFAECVHALLLHEQVNACIMLGHSMGGYITLAYALAHAELLRGYGFVHSTAYADNEEKKQPGKRASTAFANTDHKLF